MSEDIKELKEDGVFYHESTKSVYSRSRKTPSTYLPPVLRKLNAFEKSVMTGKNVIFSQTRNANTGHWIKRNEISGELIVGDGLKPFAGVVVRRKFSAASNPTIDRKTAEMAERAVLAILNRSLKK